MKPDTRPTMSTHEPMAPAAVLEKPAYAPMGPATRGALGVMGGAAAMGVLGDALLRATPWGINLTLWTLALVAAALGLRRWAGLDAAGRAWMPMALVIAVLMAWRDSPTLKGLDLAALCIVIALAMHRARGARLRTGGVVSYLAGIGRGAFDTMMGPPVLVFNDVRWGELSRGRGATHLLPLLRGLALALPVLGVFAALLVAADAAFAGMMNRVFQVDGLVLMSHLFVGGAFAWVSAGALRGLALADDREPPAELPVPGPFLGVVEVTVVLGLLNALFVSFVAVQLPYLFGTSSAVEAAGALGYAEYARRGFFELVWVAGLVLPLLLGLHAAMRRGEPGHERVFRWLAGVQVALLFVIIASALHRMRLYQNAYGLTELRLYTTAFMFWLAAVFGWFFATVLLGRRERFTFGALVMAGEALVILHAVNPDARIVHTNAARAMAERPFDARYASGLSADAVPGLLSALPHAAPAQRCAAGARILRRWGPEPDADWRSWSVARSRARAAVRVRAAVLREGCPAEARPVASRGMR